MTKRRAWFLVSGKLIREALALPESTEILRIFNNDSMDDTFKFMIEDGSLPEIDPLEGDGYPQINPTFTADYDKKPSTWIKCELTPTEEEGD